ncbi:MAG: double-strand break repair helicase AddA [Acetobacteraceae bacterium]
MGDQPGEIASGAAARASAHQREAADPAVSAFVAASAGSGKTKLLTDRLLRLMLNGADPARILCLTFTKAAAAEMALRLQDRLGRWVGLPDPALDQELRDLAMPASAATRATARRLFAEVLDLPGGMRISTIHAFCQSLLRRFPLEAGISPHFRLIEDQDEAEALAEATEASLARAGDAADAAALARLAGFTDAGRFRELVQALLGARPALAALDRQPLDALVAAQRRALGVKADDLPGLLAGAVTGMDPALAPALRRVAERGARTVAERAGEALAWLGLDPLQRQAHWEPWQRLFLTEKGEPRADRGLVNKKLAESDPGLLEALRAEAARVADVADQARGLEAAAVSAAFLRLALPVARGFAEAKSRTGQLDYHDLIGLTAELLVDPGAAWVLYKLDGGLDHLLLDEVQDTAPAQWAVAEALTGEFFAGLGARDAPPRTVFAVGDRKQSIFSFQGADAAGFDAARGRLAARVGDGGGRWVERPLDVSFRSTAPVLALVDAVFADPLASAGVAEAGSLRHFASRGGAGSVELWPLAPRPEAPPPPPWSVPEQYQREPSAAETLAETLASWIAGAIGRLSLPDRGRSLAPGDVMVLMRRRHGFAHALLRALKAAGVPTAGMDRMTLTEQPAVADLLALCDALLLPEDDLAFACYLTSPLGGLDDPALMALAVGRPGALWEALRDRAGERADWQDAWDRFAALRARVDHAPPYALLAEALGPQGGRARLFARLGAEAGEPVDELLEAALTYARTHPPSLQGFLHWLRRSGAEVKREPETAGGSLRILTAHGAKGLQAPLVILPDTTGLPPEDRGLLWAADPAGGPAVPLFLPSAGLRPAAAAALLAAGRRRCIEEYNRLLYVALTRAEDRLVVCGWAPRGEAPEESWYQSVARGFARLEGVTTAPGPAAWAPEVRRLERVAPARPAASRRAVGPPEPLPAWAGAAPEWRGLPPPPEPARPRPLAPSRPEGVRDGPVPAAASPLVGRGGALARGRAVHVLLQHLPALPPDRQEAAARDFLTRPGAGVAPAEVAGLVGEVLAVLRHPGLTPAFGPGSRAEVPLTGVVEGAVVGGLVDRLAVTADAVWVVDYKTDRAAPEDAASVPVAYRRQLAAYRAVLSAALPGRRIRSFLVWTVGARVMEVMG